MEPFVSYQVETKKGNDLETFGVHFISAERASAYMNLRKKAAPNRDFWVVRVTREVVDTAYALDEL